MNKKGQITIPTDVGFVDKTLEIANMWGADAIRDCDGTVMPDELKRADYKLYSTYFVIRGDNDWANANLDELARVYLMSERALATDNTLKIPLLKGYCIQQLQVDYRSNPQKYWQCYDRTTGKEVSDFTVDEQSGAVIIKNAVLMHEYTVSFLAFCIWDPVQMYNYITNDWDREKQMMYDPIYPKTHEYVKKRMRDWLQANLDTKVVRFTTFLYQFSLLFNDKLKEKYVEWFGYTMSVSPKMLDMFEAEYGYALTAEDFIDSGYYNNTFRVPTKKFLDYIDFVQRQVTKIAGELVKITHENNREAMMFLGDCWIGAEPYGKYFKDINLDAVVGSIGGGVTVRMLTDIPNLKYTEGRFLPYFFPDTFYEGNDPSLELNQNWITARRAMLVKPLDRIGYGGYLSLAAKFPKFVSRVTQICDEFRMLYGNIKGLKPHSNLKIAVLNAWGKIRSWQSHMVAHELWYQKVYSYQGILEALSGLAVEVEFLSFDDILSDGIPSSVDVIINAGDAGTSFSGGDYWKSEKLVALVKQWVYNGGGFIGVGEPTAVNHGGRFFQLADVLGVDKEIGFSLSSDKYNITKDASHFITDGIGGAIDYGEGIKSIYALDGASILDIEFSPRFSRKVNVGEVKMAVNDFGKGRGFYIAGIPFSLANARLLYRAMHYVSRKEKLINKAYCANFNTDCHYYPSKDLYALVNNTSKSQETDFYDINGNIQSIKLEPMEIRWL